MNGSVKRTGLYGQWCKHIQSIQKADQEWLGKAELSAKEVTKEAQIKQRRKILETEEDRDSHYNPGTF